MKFLFVFYSVQESCTRKILVHFKVGSQLPTADQINSTSTRPHRITSRSLLERMATSTRSLLDFLDSQK